MERKHQLILKRMQLDIVKDVDSNNVIDLLISNLIIHDDDIDTIREKKTRSEKTRTLLEILPKRGREAYEIFREALRKHYSWLSKDMDAMEGQEDSVDHPNGHSTPDIEHYAPTPDLPPKSPSNVPRTEKVEKLQKALEQLKPNGFVVLHGMKGFGKSSLATTTLEDPELMKKFFKNEVYWMKFGQDQSEDILIQLNLLFHRVRNLEMLSEPTNVESLRYSLEEYFKKKHHALLVLDDVCDNNVINAFNFRCKKLVMTTDMDVLEGKPIGKEAIIEMNDGFTEAESLNLFAKTLKIDVGSLPPEAKSIHKECRGMPLMIAMLAAQFEQFSESMESTPDKWRYFLKALKKKDSEVVSGLQQQKAIFDMCYDQLEPNLKKCYKDLAIFVEDVNITPKTLEILWEEDMVKVDIMMYKFCKKSLAARQWNHYLKSYIYGVHDLLLCYLRDKFSNQIEQLHKLFIEKYRERCGGDFSELPNDNYIYSYIGHHLELAKMYDEFPKLYLDFNFIQAKLCNTGPSDLLIDLKKYRKYITDGDKAELVSKVTDLERFLEEQANTLAEYRRRNCLDLIQVAMKHPYPGFVRQTAQELAQRNPTSLYLRHAKENRDYSHSISEELCTDVRTSCYTDDPNKIIIGTNRGEIYLWDFENHRQLLFCGGDKENSIRKILVSTYSQYFVSLSDDGTAKMFALSDENSEKNCGSNGETMKTPSPMVKQPCWTGIFPNNFLQDNSLVTFSVPGEKILDVARSQNDDQIAGCTDKGTLQVWNRRGETLFRYNTNNNPRFQSVVFTTNIDTNKTFLHVAVQDTSASILIIDAENGTYVTQFNLRLSGSTNISLQPIPRKEELIVLIDTKIVRLQWSYEAETNTIYNFDTQVIDSVPGTGTVYTCAVLTYDGNYLVVADSGGSVNIWKINQNFEIVTTYRHLVTSLDTYCLNDEIHLICGSGQDKLVHRWKFQTQKKLEPLSNRLPLFDATMKPDGKDILAVATSARTVQVLQNDRILAETSPSTEKVTSLVIYQNGDKIVYGMENGAVNLFELKYKRDINILKLNHPVGFMTVLNIEGENTIVCANYQDYLRIWENHESSYVVENTGYVVAIHLINGGQQIITVAHGPKIMVWDNKWRRRDVPISLGNTPNTMDSRLSHSETYLAIAEENGRLMLLEVKMNEELQPRKMELSIHMDKKFQHRLTCCEFSHDDKLLAVGTDNGGHGYISIIDVPGQMVIHQLQLHGDSIKQLYWAPCHVGAPILMSLSSDELAWWNIALLEENKRLETRSRMGNSHSTGNIVRSISTTSMTASARRETNSSSLESSQNCESSFRLEKLTLNNNDSPLAESMNSENNISHWKTKKAKGPGRPGLLGVVKLNVKHAAKVCVSQDFSKFVTIDGNGSIYNLTLFA